MARHICEAGLGGIGRNLSPEGERRDPNRSGCPFLRLLRYDYNSGKLKFPVLTCENPEGISPPSNNFGRSIAAGTVFLVSHARNFGVNNLSERWPSGLRRTPAKRVYPKRVPRVQIPLSPPLSERAPVAQLDRAPDYGSGGWGFKSLRARQTFSIT
jgi:hypothetical protein